MESMSDNEMIALEIAQFLEAGKGESTIAIHVGDTCSFTDWMVITTVTSIGHLRGLRKNLYRRLGQIGLAPKGGYRSDGDSGWTLIDCNFVIIHLMTPEMRSFYELERIWFEGATIFRSGETKNG